MPTDSNTKPAATLEQAEFFRVLSPQRLAQVQPHLRERKFQRQDVLFFEAQPAEFIWVIRSGTVRLCTFSADGRVTTLDTVGPGEIFGALSAVEDDAAPASAETLSAGSAWCLPRKLFLRLLSEEPRLGVEILQIVSRRLRDAHERLRSLAHDPAPTRLARALLKATHNGHAEVTRRALAEAAGTTVETAIRVLRRFEQDGVIRGAVGSVSVLDGPALRRLAGEADE
ncbi:MAG: Crp/Fnr family transcriptional regulator [Candidatus Binatia bacterium]